MGSGLGGGFCQREGLGRVVSGVGLVDAVDGIVGFGAEAEGWGVAVIVESGGGAGAAEGWVVAVVAVVAAFSSPAA